MRSSLDRRSGFHHNRWGGGLRCEGSRHQTEEEKRLAPRPLRRRSTTTSTPTSAEEGGGGGTSVQNHVPFVLLARFSFLACFDENINRSCDYVNWQIRLIRVCE